jgi:hypothetical protein
VLFAHLVLSLTFSAAPAAAQAAPENGGRVYAKPLPEGVHAAGEYYAVRAGTVWKYAAGKERPTVSVNSIENWTAHVSLSWGKRSTTMAWRVKDGAWLERSGSHPGTEIIFMPAQLQVGTRWKGPSSVERSGKDESTFEVLAIDATVEGDQTYDHCLAVLETSGGAPLTHFYAPNVGKVGVKGDGDEWVLKLVEYRPGRHVNGD